ncbi:MAG: hypothetical protein ABGX83_01135 [Nitrospira sp.]|nr:hypothetical protein [Candidatus Manganitrophaceae bacterium]HIL35159.1 hypothetical protein [Candidatus Manganitrophaceae bacterium]
MLKVRAMIWTLVFVFGLLAAAPSAWTCSSMGPGKHMGVVRTSDPLKGVLVIIDAESQHPIHFLTSGELLRKVHADDTVIVTFTTHEDQLIAKEIVVHLAKRNPMS